MVVGCGFETERCSYLDNHSDAITIDIRIVMKPTILCFFDEMPLNLNRKFDSMKFELFRPDPYAVLIENIKNMTDSESKIEVYFDLLVPLSDEEIKKLGSPDVALPYKKDVSYDDKTIIIRSNKNDSINDLFRYTKGSGGKDRIILVEANGIFLYVTNKIYDWYQFISLHEKYMQEHGKYYVNKLGKNMAYPDEQAFVQTLDIN